MQAAGGGVRGQPAAQRGVWVGRIAGPSAQPAQELPTASVGLTHLQVPGQAAVCICAAGQAGALQRRRSLRVPD